jgi:hypothetical protein
LDNKPIYKRQKLFRTEKHIYTVDQNKKAQIIYDKKWFVLDNDINTFA